MRRPFSLLLCCCLVRICSEAGGTLEQELPQEEEEESGWLFSRLKEQARALAAQAAPAREEERLPRFLADLDYERYLRIHVPAEQSLWHGEPLRFRVQFFHPGYLYREPVGVSVVERDDLREIPFNPSYFDYSRVQLPGPVPEELSFAGIRLLYPLHRATQMDEVAVFLGMSYFRLLGARQVFGASLRGLAIDTAEPGGEEFPRFSHFFVERPGEGADHIRVYGLLESRRVTGAFAFLIRPGEVTDAEVRASLYFREEVKKVGVAALTSMFLFGENRTRFFPDFRPEVHDSDGLLVKTREQGWLWRPLHHPQKVHRVTEFPDALEFGLLQRDRCFDHYQDLEARSELRPSLWVRPKGDWGPGRVELVEIPSEHEGNDNIVVYWVPERRYVPQEEVRFHYTASACLAQPMLAGEDLWRVADTRLEAKGQAVRYVLEFTAGPRVLTARARSLIGLRVAAEKGEILHQNLQVNQATGGMRVVFDHVPAGEELGDLRVQLLADQRIISETWVYPAGRP